MYYGWRIAWALAVTQTVGYGVLFYAFSVLITPMEAELGWSRAETSGAFSLALLLSGLVAIPVGGWVDRRGARGLMTLGSGVGAGLVLAWSFADNLPTFYLVQGGIGLVMGMVLYDVAFTVLAGWFERDYARALLLVTAVAGLASTIFVPLTTFLVTTFDWRIALRALALILALTTMPLHALVLRKRSKAEGAEGAELEPHATPESVAGGVVPKEPTSIPLEAMRARPFRWLTLSFALDRVAVVAVAVHGVPLLLERGYPLPLVAAAVGSIGLMQVAGRFLFAPATERVPLRTLTAATFVVRACAFTILFLPGSLSGVWSVWLFAALFGTANGASTLARAALVANLYGPAHYGAINGGVATVVALVQTTVPLGVGLFHDALNGYNPVLWGLTGTTLLAAFAVTRVHEQKIPTP